MRLSLGKWLAVLSVAWVAVSVWVYRSVEVDHQAAHAMAAFRAPPASDALLRRLQDEPGQGVELEGALRRLAQALRIKTVSREAGVVDHPEGFLALHRLAAEHFPLLHEHASKEVVGNYSLLFHLRGGTAPEEGKGALLPAMVMGHLDVVPVAERDLDQWDFEPFSGHVMTDKLTGRRYIYGRGTMDDKMSCLAIMEAVESLLRLGFRPRRSFYFFFGHDEEVGGAHGARAAARMLHERGVRLHVVVDEGGLIGDGLLPGIEGEVSLISIGEKGFVDVELSVNNTGGHSASPPLPPTAVGRLARALTRLEGNQFRPNLDIMKQTVAHLGERAPLSWRLAFSNLGLFRPLLERVLTAKRTVASSVRTVISPTMLEGSEKSNVMPTKARAVVNFRIMPPDTVASVVDHVRRVVSDPLVRVERARAQLGEDAKDEDPVMPSPVDGEAYRALAAAVRSLNPDRPVAPMMCPGMTDSRHFGLLTPNVFRFIPFKADSDDIQRFHGISERVDVKDVARSIRFYQRLLLNLAA